MTAKIGDLLAGTGISPACHRDTSGRTVPPAGSEIAAAALRDGWQVAERPLHDDEPLGPPATIPAGPVGLFDLGQRLHAAHTGNPVPRTARTPYRVNGRGLVAVHAMRRADGALIVTVEGPGSVPVTGRGHEGLEPLVSPLDRALTGPDRAEDLTAAGHETLIVADRATLALLRDVAATAPQGGVADRAGGLIDWWTQRSEHPGTGAVLLAADACQTRWMAGSDLRHVPGWAEAFGLAGTPTRMLLGLADRLTAGPALPAHGDGDDRWAWKSLCETTGDWRRSDSPRRSALGLVSRNAAASLWSSGLLADPGWAARERYTDRVVIGTAHAHGPDHVNVSTVDGTCRHRPGDTVEVTADGNNTPAVTGEAEVETVTVRPDGGVILSLRARKSARDKNQMAPLAAAVLPDRRAVVRPEPASPGLAARQRIAVGTAYPKGGSWATSRDVPAPRIRRDVPLAVIFAGAS